VYEELQAERNPYFQMHTACKLVLVASAQHHVTHLGQTFANRGGTLPSIVPSFVTCPDDPFAPVLRVILDRTIQDFLRAHGLVTE
jgi:hypothetical protein